MNTNALFNIGYGLYVLTANDGIKDNGCIINTVMQVTSNPLQIAIAVNKQNYTTGMIQKTKKFNVSMLTEKTDFETFKHFAFQSGANCDKFEQYTDVKRSPNGLLYITKNTNAFLSAYVKQEIDLNSHIMFIGQLVASEVLSEDPSLTYAYYHKNLKPNPQKETKKSGWRCKICGYIYEGENIPEDFICPWCKHGVADFEPIE